MKSARFEFLLVYLSARCIIHKYPIAVGLCISVFSVQQTLVNTMKQIQTLQAFSSISKWSLSLQWEAWGEQNLGFGARLLKNSVARFKCFVWSEWKKYNKIVNPKKECWDTRASWFPLMKSHLQAYHLYNNACISCCVMLIFGVVFDVVAWLC